MHSSSCVVLVHAFKAQSIVQAQRARPQSSKCNYCFIAVLCKPGGEMPTSSLSHCSALLNLIMRHLAHMWQTRTDSTACVFFQGNLLTLSYIGTHPRFFQSCRTTSGMLSGRSPRHQPQQVHQRFSALQQTQQRPVQPSASTRTLRQQQQQQQHSGFIRHVLHPQAEKQQTGQARRQSLLPRRSAALQSLAQPRAAHLQGERAELTTHTWVGP